MELRCEQRSPLSTVLYSLYSSFVLLNERPAVATILAALVHIRNAFVIQLPQRAPLSNISTNSHQAKEWTTAF